MLNQRSTDLMDTERYRAALSGLSRDLQEGLKHVRQKNIELWKTHSDEATRCAVDKNREVLAKCGLTCLFNKVPMHHKKGSQNNLLTCLTQKGGGARVPQSLQTQVFESWYAKDLGYEVAEVWQKFYFFSGALGLLVMFFMAKMCGSPRE